MYGGYELRRGDHDPSADAGRAAKWGGEEVTVVEREATIEATAIADLTPARSSAPVHGQSAPPEQPPAEAAAGAATLAAAANPVQTLQEDLRHLGFLLVGTPDGGFGTGTEFAVREFQYYASLDKVARWGGDEDTGAHEVTASTVDAKDAKLQRVKDAKASFPKVSSYVQQLEQVDNGEQYTGAITGQTNARTSELIAHWKTNRWRCPVVIEAWSTSKGTPTSLHKSNLWGKGDVESKTYRMLAFDVTGVHSLPAGYADDTYVTVGQFSGSSGSDVKGGPNVVKKYHSWSDSDTDPEGFTGKAWSDLTDGETSTFKVVRLCAENECYGRFDVINCWDNAFVSLGPCHWTLALGSGKDKGELPAFLGYFEERQAASGDDVWFHAHGLRSASGKRGDLTSQRKYVGAIAITTGATTSKTWPDTTTIATRRKQLNQFRTWHWAYRWVMAGRATDPRYVAWRHAMWDMARGRVKDLLDAPIKVTHARLGAGLDSTIGDVFTSEWAVALLTRWHIWRPGHLVADKSATTRLQDAVKEAIDHDTKEPTWGTTSAGAPSGWGNAHEKNLIFALKAAAQAYDMKTLTKAGKAALKAYNKANATKLEVKDLVYTAALEDKVDAAEDYDDTFTNSISGDLTIASMAEATSPDPTFEAEIVYKLPKVCKRCDAWSWTHGKTKETLSEARGSFKGAYPEAPAADSRAVGEGGGDVPER